MNDSLLPAFIPDMVLSTSIQPPRLHRTALTRNRLLSLLDEGMKGALTYVHAPAGFGKTTLLASWCAQLRERGARVLWVSLDEQCGDGAEFWLHVMGAFCQGVPRIAPLLKPDLFSTAEPPIRAVLVRLLNLIAQDEQPTILILDDFHVVSSARIHEHIQWLSEHLPSNFHLLISSRADAPFPLTRLMVRNQLTHIGVEDLRFSQGEATSLLQDAMGLLLGDDETEAVLQAAGGWAAALRLVASTVRKRVGPATKLERLFSEPVLVDFLNTEVLSRLDPHTLEFLESTCILDPICTEQCIWMTGEAQAGVLLEQLMTSLQLVTQLDGVEERYRYHPLLSMPLRTRLKEKSAERWRILHKRAAEWHLNRGEIINAVNHLLEGSHFSEAEALIIKASQIHPGQPSPQQFIAWHRTLAARAELTNAELVLCFARAYGNTRQYPEAIRLIDAIEAVLLERPELAEGPVFRAEAMVIRAAAKSFYEGDDAGALPLVKAALDALPADAMRARAFALRIYGYTLGQLSNVASSLRYLEEGIELSLRLLDYHGLYWAYATYQAVLILAAEPTRLMTEGQRIKTRVGQTETWSFLVAGFVDLTNALVAMERDELEQARQATLEAVQVAVLHRHMWQERACRMVLTEVLAAMGDHTEAEVQLELIRELSRNLGVNNAQARFELHEALIYLGLKNYSRAAACIPQWRDVPTSPPNAGVMWVVDEVRPIICAQIALSQGEPQIAARWLEPILHSARLAGRISHLMDSLSVTASACVALGQLEEARAHFLELLTLAQPRGYLRTFHLLTHEAASILCQCEVSAEQRPLLAHIRAVHHLEAGRKEPEAKPELPRPVPPPAQSQPSARPAGPILVNGEPLTDRELEVLQCLADGMTNKDIAEELELTVATIKWYVSRILEIFRAKNRTEAVARARRLALLR